MEASLEGSATQIAAQNKAASEPPEKVPETTFDPLVDVLSKASSKVESILTTVADFFKTTPVIDENTVLPVESHDFSGEVAMSSIWKEDIERARKEVLKRKQEIIAGKRRTASVGSDSITIPLRRTTHLMFIIHGIGEHRDFANFDVNWDGKTDRLEGGNFDLRLLISRFLSRPSKHSATSSTSTEWYDGLFADIPLDIVCESVEWHDEIHQEFPVGKVVSERLNPNGVKVLRDFINSNCLDGLLYLSPKSGQRILESVAEKMNAKYAEFCEGNPNFAKDGIVTVFAHSLGTVIMVDLLSGSRPDIVTPKLNFKVRVLFLCGSPVSYFRLSRGDLFDENGNYSVNKAKRRGVLPAGIRVVNFVHPLDVVSYKIGGMLDTEEEGKQVGKTVTIPKPSAFSSSGKVFIADVLRLFMVATHCHNKKTKAFEMCANIEERVLDVILDTAMHEQFGELAYALVAHSSYWTNPGLVLCLVSTLLEPLFPVVASLDMLKHNIRIAESHTPDEMITDLEAFATEFSAPVTMSNLTSGFQAAKLLIMKDRKLYFVDECCETKLDVPWKEQKEEKWWKVVQVVDLEAVDKLFTWKEANNFRILFNRATTVLFRAHDAEAFESFLGYLEAHLPADVIQEELEVIKNKRHVLSFFVIEVDSSSPEGKPKSLDDLRRVVLDNNDMTECVRDIRDMVHTSLAAVPQAVFYLVSITLGKDNGEEKRVVLLRKDRDFEKLHFELTKELRSVETSAGTPFLLPGLPSTPLLPNLDEVYLNKKTILYNGYLRQLNCMKEVFISAAWRNFANSS